VALRRKTLEIVSAVDLDSSYLGSMVQVLSIAARTHVADARHLVSGSKKLAAAGLTSVIDEAATIPETFLNPVLLRDTQDDGHSWTKREIASCINAIRPKREAPATETPWGVTATFALDWTNAVRSVLEVRPDTSRPLFGKGIAVTLWTPVRGGPLEALVWNEREAAPRGTGDVLGGWWAPEGGFLVHRSFYPAALCQPDLVVQFLQTDVRRAYAANKCVAALE
jgi:hypothetical protein